MPEPLKLGEGSVRFERNLGTEAQRVADQAKKDVGRGWSTKDFPSDKRNALERSPGRERALRGLKEASSQRTGGVPSGRPSGPTGANFPAERAKILQDTVDNLKRAKKAGDMKRARLLLKELGKLGAKGAGALSSRVAPIAGLLELEEFAKGRLDGDGDGRISYEELTGKADPDHRKKILVPPDEGCSCPVMSSTARDGSSCGRRAASVRGDDRGYEREPCKSKFNDGRNNLPTGLGS